MTELRFQITQGIILEPLLRHAYFAAWGRNPRPTQIESDGENIRFQSDVNRSGTVHVLVPHKYLGVTVESTETLISRPRSYRLLQELARGSLGRLVRRLFDWQMQGFRLSSELSSRLTIAARRFSSIILSADPDSKRAWEFVSVLEELHLLSLDCFRFFTEQRIQWRTRTENHIPLQFGVGFDKLALDTLYEFDLYSQFLHDGFHTVIPQLTWRDLEPEPDLFRWDLMEKRFSIPSRFGLETVFGPMLSFCKEDLPHWLLNNLKRDGFLETYATRFVNAAAERYGSSAQSWIIANHINSFNIPEISTQRAIMLVRMLASQLRSRGIETPLMVGIDQPWGEYSIDHPSEYDLIHIAELLIGCREIDSFLLEIHLGFGEHQTLPRDPMSISNLLDQWCSLGKQIFLAVSVPSSLEPDFSEINDVIEPEYRWSEGSQQFWTDILLKTALSKRFIQGVYWFPLQDQSHGQEDTRTLDDTALPFSGLIDSNRVLKLAFKHFVALRQSLLK
jgi:hypothetical protein